MKKIFLSFLLFFSISGQSLADCRMPLLVDLQRALKVKLEWEEWAGKHTRYDKPFAISEMWKNEPNELKKLAQVPLVPLYVVLDFFTLPLLPFTNTVTWFKNRGVDLRKEYYKKFHDAHGKESEVMEKALMLQLLRDTYAGNGHVLQKVADKTGMTVDKVRRKIKLWNMVGFSLCNDQNPTGLNDIIERLTSRN